MAIYAKIKGTQQGAITGAVAATSYTGQIEVHTVLFGVGGNSDVSTGQPTGKRVARPVVITKPMDRSSPLLHRSCVTNETLTVDISYLVEGQDHKAYATLGLTNALLLDFNQDATLNGNCVERLTFTYTKIEMTWVDGGIVSEHDWSATK